MKQKQMGAPRSHQRTWANYEFFECLRVTSRNGRWASPVFFGPRTLVRTWGTHLVLLSPDSSSPTGAIVDLTLPYGLSLLKTWSLEMSLNMTNAAKISRTTKAAW
jgi:hypothetical protein